MNPTTLDKAYRALRCRHCDCKISRDRAPVRDKYGDVYCDRQCRDHEAALQARMHETTWDIGDRD